MRFSSSVSPQICCKRRRERVEIGKAMPEDRVHFRIIDASIVMDDQITKTGHIQHGREEVLRQHTLFGQNAKDVLVVVGVAESTHTDQASAYIQAHLNGHL